MENLLSYTFAELKQKCLDNGYPAHAAYQLFNWIYRKFNFSFGDMSDISKKMRDDLKDKFQILNLTLIDALTDSSKETVKFLFETQDKNHIEAVLIFADDSYSEENDTRITLCVSSQAGCALGCGFCATGLLGFKRNLDAGEIISQVLFAEDYIERNGLYKNDKSASRKISNIVFMGMGEPLLNYDNTLKSIHILKFSGGYNLGSRHFTLSTAGIIPQIEALQNEKEQIRLAVSLHSADQNKRAALMPVSKKYPLAGLIKALKAYQEKSGRRITFEYVLIEKVNDSEEDAAGIKTLLSGLDYNLNVIAYNPLEELPYMPPSENTIRLFTQYLKKLQIPFVFRRSKGREIKAACGQLGLFWKNKKVS